MTLVSGPLSTVTTTPSAVTQVEISINTPRTTGTGLMTAEQKIVAVTGGNFSSQIAPGPAALSLIVGGRKSTPIPILVDDVASQTLAEVVESTIEYEPAVVSRAVAKIEGAVAAAVEDEMGAHVRRAEGAAVSAEASSENAVDRVEALEAMGGLSPQSPVDGQTANLVLQGDSLTRAAISGLFAEDPPGSGLFTIPGGDI